MYWNGGFFVFKNKGLFFIFLLILSFAGVFVSLKALPTLHAASDYVDEGVMEFAPHQVFPTQVEVKAVRSRHSHSARDTTRTVYILTYRATNGSGYEWKQEVPSNFHGKERIRQGTLETRRVLSIPKDHTYVTVAPDETAKSYAGSMRMRYLVLLGISAAYIALYLLAACILHLKHKPSA